MPAVTGTTGAPHARAVSVWRREARGCSLGGRGRCGSHPFSTTGPAISTQIARGGRGEAAFSAGKGTVLRAWFALDVDGTQLLPGDLVRRVGKLARAGGGGPGEEVVRVSGDGREVLLNWGSGGMDTIEWVSSRTLRKVERGGEEDGRSGRLRGVSDSEGHGGE